MRSAIRTLCVPTSPGKALASLPDGAVVAVSGFNMVATPESLILELMRLYERTGHPRDLFLIADSLPAVPGRALDKVAERICKKKDAGLIRGMSVPFFGFAPWLQKLVTENLVEAYTWPMGVAAYWFREVASGRPGVISKIGIDTSIDPRKEGGKLNALARERSTCSVSRIALDGEEYLFYEAPKPTAALIRATTADILGNLTMEEEPLRGTVLSMAQATKAHPNPGIVIAQVKRVRRTRHADPREVEVPGTFVDYVVKSPLKYHWQSGSSPLDPRLSLGLPRRGGSLTQVTEVEPLHMVIGRRVLLELVEMARRKGSPVVVNLGIGIPALISTLAAQEGVTDYIVTVLESGPWGGVALSGVDFGIALNPFALSTMPDMFSNFEGGVIDAASLGFLQVERSGDVNPSMLPGRIYGPGGFPVIAGGSPRIFFAGAFTAGDSRLEVGPAGLRIAKDGATTKFVEKVYSSFFSGSQALKYGKEVVYVTERAVFKLTDEGLVLTELAPGVDLDRDVLSRMEFAPKKAKNVEQMDGRVFRLGPMGLGRELASGKRRT